MLRVDGSAKPARELRHSMLQPWLLAEILHASAVKAGGTVMQQHVGNHVHYSGGLWLSAFTNGCTCLPCHRP